MTRTTGMRGFLAGVSGLPDEDHLGAIRRVRGFVSSTHAGGSQPVVSRREHGAGRVGLAQCSDPFAFEWSSGRANARRCPVGAPGRQVVIAARSPEERSTSPRRSGETGTRISVCWTAAKRPDSARSTTAAGGSGVVTRLPRAMRSRDGRATGRGWALECCDRLAWQLNHRSGSLPTNPSTATADDRRKAIPG